MARLARAEVFDPSEVAVLHICARTAPFVPGTCLLTLLLAADSIVDFLNASD